MTPVRPPQSPETWPRAVQLARRLWGPLDRFLQIEAASGIVLLSAAVIALLWANSPWSAAYEHLWHTPIKLTAGNFAYEQSLHFWINEGLMTIFFFVVGLEIRREIHGGELADVRRAALPIVAALGGMLAPALIYYMINHTPDVSHGWGVPTATDIAFAVGVLALLGKRVPPALRVLLLALAIIDDIGAIVVIAFFYSSGVSSIGFVIAAGGVGLVLALQRFGVRNASLYVIPGVILWIGMLTSGVHPTISGVVLGLLTPAKPWFGREGFVAEASKREAVAPVVRLQAALHGWVAYGIMPIFALANAGVNVRGVSLSDPKLVSVAAGIALGLVVGKPLGIMLVSMLCVRLGICALPRGVTWRGILLVGTVAGIGFTMAIFIAGLAFQSAAQLAAAKLAVLLGSTIAATLGMIVGRLVLRGAPDPGAAVTLSEAEASTDR